MMGSLERILAAFRGEAERLEGQAPPGAGESDLRLLSYEQLDRLDELVTRAVLQEGGRRLGSGGHYAGRNEQNENWDCDCACCGLPADPEPLSEDELAEVEDLLSVAGAGEAPEPWEREG